MTCKDCIHYEAHSHFDPLFGFNDENVEKYCPVFKDKSKYIELPCKVGDYAYRVAPPNEDSKQGEGYKIIPICMSSVLNIVKAMKEQHDWETITRPQIGWLFFYKAEAEAKLKELNENAE